MISISSSTGQILCGMEQCAAQKGDFFCVFLQVTQKEVHLSVHEYEHRDVSESIDFEDTNLSSVGFAK